MEQTLSRAGNYLKHNFDSKIFPHHKRNIKTPNTVSKELMTASGSSLLPVKVTSYKVIDVEGFIKSLNVKGENETENLCSAPYGIRSVCETNPSCGCSNPKIIFLIGMKGAPWVGVPEKDDKGVLHVKEHRLEEFLKDVKNSPITRSYILIKAA